MLELTTLMTPWAAASTESPIGSAICFFHGRPGQLGVDFQPAAQYVVGIDPPQHQIGVGDHGLFIAQVIGYRPGIGARALWPHLQCARVVDVGDGAAAGAYRVDIDHGHTGGQATHLALGSVFRNSILYQRDIGTGSPIS